MCKSYVQYTYDTISCARDHHHRQFIGSKTRQSNKLTTTQSEQDSKDIDPTNYSRPRNVQVKTIL